ncbi:putative HTH-type transcriptional regulator YdhC [Shouchella clausii]|nr:putative HTH-type transcriptional regulator YdhC [Shouchella clausii]
MTNTKLEKPIPYFLQFYNHLKNMIYRGELAPGEKINETQLAKRLGVSRSPIREAMRLLEKDGLLQPDEKTGSVVCQLTATDAEQLYKIRIALESLAVEMCIEHASDADLDHIGEELALAEKAIAENKPQEAIIDCNQTFHQLLAKYSYNPYLKKQLESLDVLIYYCRVINMKGENRASVIEAEHRRIYEALRERQREKAIELIVKHLTHDLEHLKSWIDGNR